MIILIAFGKRMIKGALVVTKVITILMVMILITLTVRMLLLAVNSIKDAARKEDIALLVMNSNVFTRGQSFLAPDKLIVNKLWKIVKRKDLLLMLRLPQKQQK